MSRLAPLVPLALLLLPAAPARAQSLEACDPVESEICASVDFAASGTDLWVTAAPSGSTASVTGLSFTIPGLFASQLSSDPGVSLGSWWFTLSGGTATFGNFSPTLSGSDDAFGLLSPGLFHFALSAPLTRGPYSMSFEGLRLYDSDLDGPYYIDDFVAGSGSARINTAVTPEPAPVALLATGLLALVAAGGINRRRARA
ncbi:MAG TPA: PEP-CTERM sorting domain-containing protein [Longimicrobiaceae bacterium]|nr:PEP-CTERM sorting domain-containing protein [Longimicrobiaceae bacterium]